MRCDVSEATERLENELTIIGSSPGDQPMLLYLFFKDFGLKSGEWLQVLRLFSLNFQTVTRVHD